MTLNEVITLGISGLALFISIKTSFSNKRSNRATLLHQVKTSIDDAKTQLENLTVKLAPLKSKKSRSPDEERELDLLLKVYESSFKKVLNAYEDGCQKYYANLIIKEVRIPGTFELRFREHSS